MLANQPKSRGGARSALSALMDRTARREARVIAPLVDRSFYLATYPDVATSGLDPSFHYAKYGWREGRDPSASFSTSGYIAAHPGVAMRQANPLLHFVLSNGGQDAAVDPAADDTDAETIALVREHMDQAFYAAKYPELSAHPDPAEHYCRTGWRNGFDPAPGFSTNYYLMTNPDIKDSGVNPFWHFLIAGQAEGRLPVHPGGWRHAILSKQNGFDAYCEEWMRPDPAPELLDDTELADALRQGKTSDRLLVSVGHDDYRETPGGVQLCIQMEADRAVAAGLDYLNIHPWQPLPKLADAGDGSALCFVFNGKMIGHAALDQLEKVLATGSFWHSIELTVHHLAGHSPEQIVAFARTACQSRCQFWLHDYFTLCTSFALQRNNVASCSAPGLRSNACGVCLFGQERARQADRIAAFFQSMEVQVVAPSKVALDFWKSRTDLRARNAKVHPHLEVSRKARAKPFAADLSAPLRIGFVGTPAPHKGWPVFIELQRRLAARRDVEFLYFGTHKPVVDDIRHIDAHVTSDDPLIVSRKIAEAEVDLILHWASWRETFSFSAFEALVGGAYVLTNDGSGNVAAIVRKHRSGKVLKTVDDLYEFAGSSQLDDLCAQARRRRAKSELVPTFSEVSIDIVRMAEPA